eukprot:6524423-Alexandrium_andersonii.AAC.1
MQSSYHSPSSLSKSERVRCHSRRARLQDSVLRACRMQPTLLLACALPRPGSSDHRSVGAARAGARLPPDRRAVGEAPRRVVA